MRHTKVLQHRMAMLVGKSGQRLSHSMPRRRLKVKVHTGRRHRIMQLRRSGRKSAPSHQREADEVRLARPLNMPALSSMLQLRNDMRRRSTPPPSTGPRHSTPRRNIMSPGTRAMES